MTLDPLQRPSIAPVAGRLLVAAPLLQEATFHRSVVLLLDHDEEGTLGLVLNRPSQIALDKVLPAWSGRTTGEPVLFNGGPVGDDSALGLGRLPGAYDGPEPLGFRRLAGSLGLVDLDVDASVAAELSAVRLFAGYAGWAADQLHEELAEGAWYVVDGDPADAFTDDPAGLWARVLRRQPNDLALLGNPSEDPELN
ncbi:MAG TPA: YqgE/AlgH family protein [Candidatus Nanopelagicales bacterium]|nr:YqgE/AlgH family protein [Candidatus Nanopelagicales bacterium]